MAHNILVINPGSTSDDIGYYRGKDAVFEETARYSMAALAPYTGKNATAQIPMRRQLILDYLAKHEVPLSEIEAVIGRGGLTHPLEGGVYGVNDKMVDDLSAAKYGSHASNLGAILARDIAARAGCPSFTANPVVTDEMQPLARYSGMADNPRISIFHALSQKRIARMFAEEKGKTYEEVNCIVCHGGGGVSVGAHRQGKVVDVTNGFVGGGPMTPQRSGSVPCAGLLDMCFSGKYTPGELRAKLHGQGGLVGYTGTSDVKELEEFIFEGKKRENSPIFCTRGEAKNALDAMIYQISKYIGAMAVVLKGQVDFIALTGGLMFSKYIPAQITSYVGWIAPVQVFAGSEEKLALREAAERALDDPKTVKQYE